MALQEIDIRKTTPAPPEAVWRLLGNSETWPLWTPIESVEIVEPGDEKGLNEIRTLKTGRITVREKIVERIPERRLSYTLLSGLAVQDYRADVDLAPTHDGTEIRWHTTFTAKFPGAGFLYRRALDKATRRFVDGLAEHSADQVAGGRRTD